MSKETHFSNFVYVIKNGGFKTILKYYGLVFLIRLGRKTFIIDHASVYTTDYRITIGEEYQYKEGGVLLRVILEKLIVKNFRLRVKLRLLDYDRMIRSSFIFGFDGYGGVWKLYDKGKHNFKSWYTDEDLKDLYTEVIEDLPKYE